MPSSPVTEKNEWLTCVDDAHKIHAETRNELISRFGATDRMDAGYGSIEIIESKLGEIGAKSFMDAGVAGASPIASTADVKCLHAWFAGKWNI